MAMSLYDRQITASSNAVYQGTVMGALLTHAKWVIRSMQSNTPNYANHIYLARSVVADPKQYVFPVGFAIITEPVHDGISSASELSDTEVQNTIQDVWELFVSPA